MAAFAHISTSLTAGAAWTGTAPGGATTPSGTVDTGSDLSTYIREAAFSGEIALQDSTTAGSGGYEENVFGLKGGTLTIRFREDIADNLLDEIWYGFFGQKIYFDLKQTSSSRSASNASVICAANVGAYSVGGSIGSLAEKTVTLRCTGAWARVVA